MNKNIIISIVLSLLIGGGIGYVVASKNSPRSMVDNSSKSDKSTMQHGMDSVTAGLEGKKGEALDIAFLDGMILHHEGAIAMANQVLRETKRPELQKMAQDIISNQSAEITTMKGWLNQWYGR